MATQVHIEATESGHQISEPTGGAGPNVITNAILRATGVVFLMALAVIHVVQLVPTIEQTPILGVAYILLIAASIVVAGRLVRGGPSSAQMWLPVAALGVAVFVGYAFTRMLSTPLDNQDVGNWSCMLGLAAIFVEALLVVMSAYALSIRQEAVRVSPVATREHNHVMPIRESSDEPLVGASFGMQDSI
jgi:FtsH-binding integral membrane protein